MKKILGLAIAGIMVMAAVSGATWATFSDQAVSANNSMSAGTLKLLANGSTGVQNTFGLTNVEPGQNDHSSNVHTQLQNSGSLAGTITITTANLTHSNPNNTPVGTFNTKTTPTDSLWSTAVMAPYVVPNTGITWVAGGVGLLSNGGLYNYGTGTSATGTVVVTSGVITSVTPLTAGSGYNTNSTDVVSILDSNATPGSGAVVTATISGGVVTGFTVVAGGSGYHSGMMTAEVLEFNSLQSDLVGRYYMAGTTNPYDTTSPSGSGKTWSGVVPNMSASQYNNFCIDWEIPIGTDNHIQGATFSIDFVFTLNQR